jgi:predicted neuraminidase
MAETPQFEARFLTEPDPRSPYGDASTVVELLNGDLLAAWQAGSRAGAPDLALFSARLVRGMSHWTAPRVIQDTPGRAEGNPVLFLDPYGTLWLFWVTMMGEGWDSCILRAKTSGDQGHSWDPPGYVHDRPGWMPRNRPAILRSGEIVLPLYDQRDAHSFMLVSSDSAHWEPRGELRSPSGLIQPAVVELRDGSVAAYLRRGPQDPQRRLWRSRSGDRGNTWSVPERTALPNPDSAADVVRLANGHLVIAFNNSATERTPLTVALSLDEGRNWRYVRDVESGPGDYSSPTLIQARAGELHLTYSWQRERIKHATFAEAWIRAGDTPLPG